MNREQYLLGKIAEEAAEVAQIALKAQQFGFDSFHPDDPDTTNLDLLRGELNDLLAVVGMLDVPTFAHIHFKNHAQQVKQRKVEHFFAQCHRLGRVS